MVPEYKKNCIIDLEIHLYGVSSAFFNSRKLFLKMSVCLIEKPFPLFIQWSSDYYKYYFYYKYCFNSYQHENS